MNRRRRGDEWPKESFRPENATFLDTEGDGKSECLPISQEASQTSERPLEPTVGPFRSSHAVGSAEQGQFLVPPKEVHPFPQTSPAIQLELHFMMYHRNVIHNLFGENSTLILSCLGCRKFDDPHGL